MKNKFLLIFILISFFLFAKSNINVIKEPIPLFMAIDKISSLKIVKSISKLRVKKLESNRFLGISSATFDNINNYYFYDSVLQKIIKFDHRFKFVKYFGRSGEGPGEFKGNRNLINVGKDNFLYFTDISKRKIIKFNCEGKFIKEFKTEHFKLYRAIVDCKGNFYLPSLEDALISKYDKNMKFVKSILSMKTMKNFLFFKPPACAFKSIIFPHDFSLKYEILSNGNLIILNQTDLSIQIVNIFNGDVVKKYYVWVDLILEEYKKKLKKVFEKIRKFGLCGYNFAFTSFFIDEENNIYLQFIDSIGENYLLKFSSDMQLENVFLVNTEEISGTPIFFRFKGDHFYSYSQYKILIFKDKFRR